MTEISPTNTKKQSHAQKYSQFTQAHRKTCVHGKKRTLKLTNTNVFVVFQGTENFTNLNIEKDQETSEVHFSAQYSILRSTSTLFSPSKANWEEYSVFNK